MSEDFQSETIQSESSGTSEAPTNHLAEASRAMESSLSSDGSPSQPSEKTIQQLVDLDKLEQFVWKGKTVNRKEFENGWLRQQDYTKKTQALKESERQDQRFQDNLKIDLMAVRQNPSLIWQFKQVYPPKYHAAVDVMFDQPTQQTQQTNGQALDPAILRLLDERVGKMDQLLKSHQEREVAAIDAQLDGYKAKFETKYAFADEDSVLSRAEYLLNQKMQNGEENPHLDEQTWERLWKTDHDHHKSRFDAVNQRQLKEQKAANVRGADAPSGGSAGRPAGKVGGLKDARSAMEQYLRER